MYKRQILESVNLLERAYFQQFNKKAVINFRDEVIELDGGDRTVREKFEHIIGRVRTCRIKILQKGVSENNLGTMVSACIETEYMSELESEKSNINDAVWELRADEFCSEGEVVRSGQRAALWQVIERYRGVFAEVPGRAREYECVLQIREHTPFMQRSYPCLLYTSRCV